MSVAFYISRATFILQNAKHTAPLLKYFFYFSSVEKAPKNYAKIKFFLILKIFLDFII